MWRVWVRRGTVYRVLVEKLEGKRSLGRPRLRWVDNIRMDLQEVGCGYVDWIVLVQDRDRWRTLVSAVMNLRVPWNAGNFLTSCKPVSCWRRALHHVVIKYRVLLGKPEGKRPLGRHRHRWVNNIRIDMQEMGCGHLDWIGLAQDRDRLRTLVSAVMNLRVPWNTGNFLTSCKPVSCSGRTLHHGVSK